MAQDRNIRMGTLRFVSVQKVQFNWEHGYPEVGFPLIVDGPVTGLGIFYDDLKIVAKAKIVGDSVNIVLLPVKDAAAIGAEATEILREAKALFDGIETIHQGGNSGYGKMIALRDRINTLDVAIAESANTGDDDASI